MLCITLACFVGCGEIEVPIDSGNPGINQGGNTGDDNKPNGGNTDDNTEEKKQLAAVDKSSVTFTETAGSFVVEWATVPNATSYFLNITNNVSALSKTTTVDGSSIDLRSLDGFTLPDSGTITIVFTAKADGYIDSKNSTITYELEGTLLLSPEITSFNNGVIEWKKNAGVSSYTVKVDGKATETQNNTYDVKSLTGKVKIEISAKISGEADLVTSVMYDAGTKKLSAMPITDYTIDGEILKWGEVGGAIGYKVVDLDFNAYTVTVPHYIMTIRNIIYGVYPVMSASSVVSSAEVEPTDIKYLEGKGTQADPYLIKTPFDLRTIDYYELKTYEAGSKTKNYYKIAGNIDYNSVSALEEESNMFTLRKPFFGTLDGGGNTLSNITVNNSNGFWAMFEFIAKGGAVTNIKFDTVKITNTVQDDEYPINASVAMVAYSNYGTVSDVTLSNANISVTGGEIAGLVVHNFSAVTNCTVKNCTFKENATSALGTSAYEMAGVVLENLSGGTVSKNNVTTLTISGVGSNIGSSAGVVSINRSGATVKDNSFDGVTVKNVKSGKEVGGVVAYCAMGGTVTKGTGTLGTLSVGTGTGSPATVSGETGTSTTPRGKLYGKKG